VIWRCELAKTRRPSLILAGPGALGLLSGYAEEAAANGARLFIITDDNVLDAWGHKVVAILDTYLRSDDILSVPPGETSKSVDRLGDCWDWLAGRGCRRNDIVVALGGGVVGDLAGLVAGTYQRGVGLWQIPTTLVAQVDSSVGGKTAVNLESGKNLVGTFYQPDLVLVDPATLTTLPAGEYVGGLGEVVKYGLLDPGLFTTLERDYQQVRDRHGGTMAELVKRCIAYKAQVVEEDEFDQGRRAVLNLGHTVGHALEVTLGFGALTHGHAVALGLLSALMVSERTLGLDPEVRTRTRCLLQGLGLPVVVSLPSVSSLLAACAKDKKVTADTTGFVGLRDLGVPVWGLKVTADLLGESLDAIRT
jgi:3-dehydroquinate synthase